MSAFFHCQNYVAQSRKLVAYSEGNVKQLGNNAFYLSYRYVF